MEASSAIGIAQHTLLACALILVVGTLAAFVARKIAVPDVAIFLVAGIALGPHALGLVHIKADSALNQMPLSVTIQPVESSRKKSARQASFVGASVQWAPPSMVVRTIE